ncbi:MAG: DUF4364 family protein [Clostridiales bacterium]|nr:DUF4364 family protein [Clostridiales bacterium]
MAEPFTIYKLTILYMLSHSGEPLTNMQIALFFLNREYTGYFRVQEALSDLQGSGFIAAESTHQSTRYRITDSGKETLSLLSEKMSDGIERDVADYLAEMGASFREENAFAADYRKLPEKGYDVHMQLTLGDRPIVDLTLFARTKEQAEAMCCNWRQRCGDVYAKLMDTLLG